jgi:hypothetical protein
MTELLPTATSLNATPLADPLAAPTAPAAADAEPFAELLAVLVAPPAATPTVKASYVPVAAAPADSASLPSDDSDALSPDTPASDDPTLDDRLAASLSAMLAIAPPPPAPPQPIALPVASQVALPVALPAALPVASPVAPSAPARSAKTPDAPSAAVVTVGAVAEAPVEPKGTRKAAAAANDIPPTAEPTGPAPQSDGVSAAESAAPAPSSDKPADAPVVSTDAAPVRTAAGPALPATILRLLRDAPSGPVQPTVPVALADPRDAVAPTPVAAPAQASALPGRDIAGSSRREIRTTATRPTASVSRPATTKAVRSVEAERQAPVDPIAMPFAEARAPVPIADATSGQNAAPVDSLVQSQLAIGRDGQWLDSLARDIAASASGGNLNFKLQPENLGALTVSIAAMADGTAIRMTTDTDRAHQILTDAQPKLIAEARAQGLRVSESHVELNNGSSGGGGSSSGLWGQANGQAQQQNERRQQTSSPNRLPFEPSTGGEAIDASAQRTSERYA